MPHLQLSKAVDNTIRVFMKLGVGSKMLHKSKN